MLIKTWKHFVETHLKLLLTHYVNEASVDNDFCLDSFRTKLVVELWHNYGIHLINALGAYCVELWNLLLVEINAVIEVNCCAFSIDENE